MTSAIRDNYSSSSMGLFIALITVAGSSLVFGDGTPDFGEPRATETEASSPSLMTADRVEDRETMLLLLKWHGKRDARLHDPSSIVKCQGEYWCFSTGRGVRSWRSKDLAHWERGPRVFADMPAWVTDVVPTQRGHFWAPDVIFHKGRYLLYYSVSRFGRNTSAIGLASNPTLDPADPNYRWTDHGIVIQSKEQDDFNAIDPAVIKTKESQLWMAFGSFWSGIKLIQLDPKTGRRIAPDSRIYPLAHYEAIEAPHIHKHGEYYYLFVNWDLCCRGIDSTYNIRVGRSRRIAGPYLDQDGKDLLQGGGTLLLATDGPFIGPGHASVFSEGGRDWFSCHFYDGTDRGRSWLALRPLSWSKGGWPLLEPADSSVSLSAAEDGRMTRAGGAPAAGAKLECIRPGADGTQFVGAESGARFIAWGCNYDHDASGRLLEDYWQEEWSTVVEDFREMKALGANVVRIHLQLGRFMDAPDRPNEKALEQLRRLLRSAEDIGLYLDITGLGCYHKNDAPPWYDAMDEAQRWNVQARFWEAIAKACARSDAVFCYDLMNEPILPGAKKKETQWLAGEFAGKHFVQRITLDLAGRTRTEVARVWVNKLVAAIRKHDDRHMITVGVIPWVHTFPKAKPLFYSPEVSANLDFVSVHFYPEKGEVGKALKALAAYDIGKPIVIEETFPLKCGADELCEFIDGSKKIADGWISFYWGKRIDEYTKEDGLAGALTRNWLERFRAKAPEILENGRGRTRPNAPAAAENPRR